MFLLYYSTLAQRVHFELFVSQNEVTFLKYLPSLPCRDDNKDTPQSDEQ